MNTLRNAVTVWTTGEWTSPLVRPRAHLDAGTLPLLLTLPVRAGRSWTVWDVRKAMFVPIPDRAPRWHVAKRAPFVGGEHSLGFSNPEKIAPGRTALRSPRGVTYLTTREVLR